MNEPQWKYRASIYTTRDHCTLYRDETLGVQMQVMMKRDWVLLRPKERVYYFVDGVSRTFRSERAMLDALKTRGPVRRRISKLPVWEVLSGESGA